MKSEHITRYSHCVQKWRCVSGDVVQMRPHIKSVDHIVDISLPWHPKKNKLVGLLKQDKICSPAMQESIAFTGVLLINCTVRHGSERILTYIIYPVAYINVYQSFVCLHPTYNGYI